MGDLPSASKVGQGSVGCILDVQIMDIESKERASVMPPSIVPGALWGHAAAGFILVLVGYFSAYLIQFEWLLGSWSTPYVLMVVVAVMVMVLLTVRRDEGQLSLGRGFGLALLSGWLSRLGYNAFQLLFFSLLRPDLRGAYADLVLSKSMEALAVFGMGDAVDSGEANGVEALIREQALWSLSFTGQCVDAFTAGLWVALVALVVAAILRKKTDETGFQG